jgi:hypothetical protein
MVNLPKKSFKNHSLGAWFSLKYVSIKPFSSSKPNIPSKNVITNMIATEIAKRLKDDGMLGIIKIGAKIQMITLPNVPMKFVPAAITIRSRGFLNLLRSKAE